MRKPLRALLALVLSCAMVLPSVYAAGSGEGKLTLSYTKGENHTIDLSIKGLSGNTNIYAVQIELILDGSHADVKFTPASGDVDVADKAPTVSGGKTNLTLAMDSQVPMNEGSALVLGSLSAGEDLVLPTTAQLKMLDVALQEVSFAGTPSVEVTLVKDDDGPNGGTDEPSTDKPSGSSHNRSSSTTSFKADAKGQTVLPQSALLAGKSLTITSGSAELTLDQTAAAALQKSGGAVTVGLTAQDSAGQKSAQLAQSNGAPLYSVSFTASGKTADPGDGVVTLSVPYTGKGTAVAYSVGEDASFHKLSSLAAKSGKVSFSAGAGTFAVVDMNHGFSDVDGWYDLYVNTVTAKGTMQGMDSKTFAPDQTITRAELVTTLARLSGDTLSAQTAPFADVPADAWFAPYVAWAHENGVANGVSDTAFAPNGELTREQLATLLYRFSTQRKIAFSSTAEANAFADAGQISDYAREAVNLMQRAGILSGKGAGQFDPKGTATRAECAKILAILSVEMQ